MRNATPFPGLNDLLVGFVRDVHTILESSLVGVYLTGSFALGGGDRASDCDFLVVATGRVGGEREAALRQLHEQIPSRAGYWASNLEGSYAPKADLETLAALDRPWLYVDRGHQQMEWSTHCNTEDVRWVLRERPLILAGADPREFTCNVPTSALETKMRSRIASFLDDLLTWTGFDNSWAQRYAVESISRSLYTLEHGTVISKQEALEWASEAMPAEWCDLIEQVKRDRFVSWNEPPRPGSIERTLAYVEYIQKRARLRELADS
jgi:predicted nucleotidyltransferase